jgi:hypothetical protein
VSATCSSCATATSAEAGVEGLPDDTTIGQEALWASGQDDHLEDRQTIDVFRVVRYFYPRVAGEGKLILNDLLLRIVRENPPFAELFPNRWDAVHVLAILTTCHLPGPTTLATLHAMVVYDLEELIAVRWPACCGV